MSSARAYLIDASIYVFRGWHTRPSSEVDRDGAPANAVRGFAAFLLDLLESVRPGWIALVFDDSLAHCQRRELYPPYKANRTSAPPELRRQFRQCRALARAAGLREITSRQFEGDDVLATLAADLRQHGWRHTVVTGDKDLAQIVRTGDEWWDLERDRRLDMHGIRRYFGVAPHQIADLLALAGDRGDNIPGVPGVGRPTAARLLRRWGDLDAIFANLSGVRAMRFRGAPQVAERLAEHERTVRLARQLTGTLHDAALCQTPDGVVRGAPDWDALESLLDHLSIGAGERRRWACALGAGAAKRDLRGDA